MKIMRALIASLLLFAFLQCAYAPAVFITDANASVSANNEVTIYVECYDDSGNKSNHGVYITICEAENFLCNISSSSQSPSPSPTQTEQPTPTATPSSCTSAGPYQCNASYNFGTYSPGTYCAKIDLEAQSGLLVNSHQIFFVVKKKINPVSLEDSNFVLASATALAVLLLVGNFRKTER